MLKAITLHQPWASLMALGYKTIETRGRKISYRGDLAIHAGCYCDYEALQSFRNVLTAPHMPTGILAVVNLHDVKPTSELTADRYGDFSPGRYGWLTKDLIVLERPIPCRGMQGLWNVPKEVEAKITSENVRARASGEDFSAWRKQMLGDWTLQG